jgi:hypothetical protein
MKSFYLAAGLTETDRLAAGFESLNYKAKDFTEAVAYRYLTSLQNYDHFFIKVLN